MKRVTVAALRLALARAEDDVLTLRATVEAELRERDYAAPPGPRSVPVQDDDDDQTF